MNKYATLLLLAFSFLLCLPASAQSWGKGILEESDFLLTGFVQDNLTREKLYGTKVEMLSYNDSLLFTYVVQPGVSFGEESGGWGVPLPMEGQKYAETGYILRFSKKGYDTKEIVYTVPRLHKRQPVLTLPAVNLHRTPKERTLGEATVTATKVKFYSKGDTLVFNADAFQLQEGSMLDALIRQLPGVELKSDGRILVNGKQVESLLLNGEDFFKGNNQIMLDNLPTYMVKDVQVYKKEGALSEMLGQNAGDKQMVMDIKLKKQYSIGWIGNVEAGGGTAERFLAKLFGMRFTTHSRLSFYGSLNNVNEFRRPGENTDWTPEMVGDGLTTVRFGGVDYLINDRQKRFKIEGSTVVRHNDDTYDNRTSSVNFLSGGDTYGLSSARRRNHSFSLYTSHNWLFRWDKARLRIQPDAYYERSQRNALTRAASFDALPTALIKEGALDSLFRPDVNAVLLGHTLYRTSNEELTKGHAFNAGIATMTTLNMPHSMDNLIIEANARVTDNKRRAFAKRQTDYPQSGQATDYRNEYETLPYQATDFFGKLSYYMPLKQNWRMQPYYSFHRTQTKKHGSIYRLERLEGWGADSDHEVGMLPSVAAWQQTTLDGENTRRTTATDEVHTVGYYLQKETLYPSWWKMTLDLPVSVTRNALDYQRPAVIDTTMHRTVVTFAPVLTVGNMWPTLREGTNDVVKNHELEFTLRANSSYHDFSYDILQPYGRDPLNVYLGNRDLKQSWTGQASANYTYLNTLRSVNAGVNLLYSIVQNALTMGYTYDRTTGRRTYRPDNVNGNYLLSGSGFFSLPLDKAKHLTLSGNTGGTFNHNVDLIAVAGETSPSNSARSSVRNLYLSQGLKLEYGFGKVRVGAKGNGTWTHITSRRPDFATINAGDFNYGVTLKADLPFDISFSTDFTVYSRRGYTDDFMNTDDLVWNARLAKRFWGNRISVMLDGFDMLGQLSNIRRSLNGQGRSETIYHVIPRYAMLHFVYRLNVKPKNK